MLDRGKLHAEGKTKRIWEVEGSETQVIIENKDDITAGDGAKHDVIEGKGILDNKTNTNVFQLLRRSNIPTHFERQLSPTDFLALKCEMFPIEVVVRRYATGSFLKRHPGVEKGTRLEKPVVEFFYKDDARHDPIIILSGSSWNLHDAKKPITQDSRIDTIEKICEKRRLILMRLFAARTFGVLERAWQRLGYKMWDFKVEFGVHYDKLYLADVLTSAEWRITDPEGNQVDKQLYRDGVDLETVSSKFELIAELSDKFKDLDTM